PEALEWIVTKSLHKDQEERYQTAKDLLIDLKGLKHRMEFEAELDRTVTPEERSSTGRQVVASSGQVTAEVGDVSTEVAATHQTSSAEYIVSEIKRHKKSAALVLVGVIVAASAAIFFYFKSASALTEKDTILLADFINTTGDAVFDGTLKQGLAVELGQSPVLNLFAGPRVRQTLRWMGRSPDERVRVDVARELGQRPGVNTLITWSIAWPGGPSVVYANTGQPKLAAENAAKAYPLRDRVSEIEKFRISSFYYFYVTGELDKYIEVLELYKKTYPRDERPFINLSVSYDRIGQ